MSKPKFSVVSVVRNEAATLPRLLKSLSEFLARGGEFLVVDTGSTDNTAKVARDGGARVIEVGDRFRYVVDEQTAQSINNKFVVEPDPEIIHGGDAFFAFDKARNFAMEQASNDFLVTPDADEAWTTLNIDKINELIDEGYEKLIVGFVFAHNADGTPAVQFWADTRFYDRRRIHWKGIIHETMRHDGELKMCRIDRSVAFLEHYQNRETDRSKYLSGLAWACAVEPDNDRNSHYFARELMYRKYYRSAIKEFQRHIDMNGWADERGQSMVYMGGCLEALGETDKALEWYHKAFELTGTRREPLLAMAHYWKRKDKPAMVAAYAAAALQIPDNGFYGNRVSNYTYEPYALLYWARGWMGDIPGARENLRKCLEFHPTEPTFINDMKYYFTDDEIAEAKKKAGDIMGGNGVEKEGNKVFHPARNINRLALPITRACNRSCPECMARDRSGNPAGTHVTIDELKRAGELLGPIWKIEVTGGEPSLHPQFREISEGLHKWFDCPDIMLLTNGWLFEDDSYLPLLLNYERVYVSHYTPKFADKYGTPTNTEVHDKIRDYLKDYPKVKFWSQTMDAHCPIKTPPYTGNCMYGYDRSDSLGYLDGKLYGCCTAWQLDYKGRGIELTKDWRSKVADIELPCGDCWLSGTK